MDIETKNEDAVATDKLSGYSEAELVAKYDEDEGGAKSSNLSKLN